MHTIESINADAAVDLALMLPSMGYVEARVLPDGSVAALLDLLYTRAICLGCHSEGWTRRFCFTDRALADQRFIDLQSEDDVPVGYTASRAA